MDFDFRYGFSIMDTINANNCFTNVEVYAFAVLKREEEANSRVATIQRRHFVHSSGMAPLVASSRKMD